jgi:predicted aminopeptidase
MLQRLTLIGRLVALCLMLGACGSAYLTQAALGQRDLLSRRVPIQKLLGDDDVPDDLKVRLRLVLRIREFASTELGLPDNDSYRSYADLDRDYAVWNVFAAPEFSIEAKQWCFPIVGCVAYRGYFSSEKAQAFASDLSSMGFDIYVGGVAAYSTLGHFDDPVLNTMINWNDTALAAVIFHELTHQRLYVKNNSAFSESLATVVEAEGVRRWLAEIDEPGKLEAYQARKARQKQFAGLISNTRDRLKDVFQLLPGEEPDMAAVRQQKRDEFAQLKSDFERLKQANAAFSSYNNWFAQDLNNAHLVSVATYHDLVPRLESLLESVDFDLEEFFAEAEKLSKEK